MSPRMLLGTGKHYSSHPGKLNLNERHSPQASEWRGRAGRWKCVLGAASQGPSRRDMPWPPTNPGLPALGSPGESVVTRSGGGCEVRGSACFSAAACNNKCDQVRGVGRPGEGHSSSNLGLFHDSSWKLHPPSCPRRVPVFTYMPNL